jgi:hypothetical protein
VVRQLFDKQTGRYKGAVEVVQRARWYEVISEAHAAATANRLEMTAIKRAAAVVTPAPTEQQPSTEQQPGGEDTTAPAPLADAASTSNEEEQTQGAMLASPPVPVPAVEGIVIPLSALQWQLQHELKVENIPRQAITTWLDLMAPRKLFFSFHSLVPCWRKERLRNDPFPSCLLKRLFVAQGAFSLPIRVLGLWSLKILNGSCCCWYGQAWIQSALR